MTPEKEIKKLVLSFPRAVTVMEVCGTHTRAIARLGIKEILGEKVNLISGPGCPVCVTSDADIGNMVSLALRGNVTVCTFADMLRVKGGGRSLEDALKDGADIKVVYSPMDAVRLAEKSEKDVILLACGFETTAPLIAACVKDAAAKKLKNFFVYTSLKLITPAIEELLKGENKIDAFLLPGHVSLVIGTGPYAFIAEKYKKPGAVAGFEKKEILSAVKNIAEQLSAGKAEIFNAYPVVRESGQPVALKTIKEVFGIKDAVWRGLGKIKNSAFELNKKYEKFDAAKKFKFAPLSAKPHSACRCGEILKGNMPPRKCPLFNKKCTPVTPLGPCMVSAEGACGAAYEYEI